MSSTVKHMQSNVGTITFASLNFLSQQPVALSLEKVIELLTFHFDLLLTPFIW